MTYYQRKKKEARALAISWQHDQADSDDLSYAELADIGDMFREIAEKYGLIREFRENGIPC